MKAPGQKEGSEFQVPGNWARELSGAGVGGEFPHITQMNTRKSALDIFKGSQSTEIASPPQIQPSNDFVLLSCVPFSLSQLQKS